MGREETTAVSDTQRQGRDIFRALLAPLGDERNIALDALQVVNEERVFQLY